MNKLKIFLIILLVFCSGVAYYFINSYNRMFLKKNSSSEYVSDGKIHIVVDAGHGGVDPGAGSIPLKIFEKNITRKMVDAIVAMADTSKYTLLQTRIGDSFVHRHHRVDLATKFHTDLFLSFHNNYLTGGFLKGFEINISDSSLNLKTGGSIVNPYTNVNLSFGDTLSRNIAYAFPKMHNLGIRRRKDKIWVIYAPNFPSMIIEWGYINNKEDIVVMQDPVAHQVLAKAVWHSIDQHFGFIKY